MKTEELTKYYEFMDKVFIQIGLGQKVEAEGIYELKEIDLNNAQVYLEEVNSGIGLTLNLQTFSQSMVEVEYYG